MIVKNIYDIVITNGNIIEVDKGKIEKKNIGIVNDKIAMVSSEELDGETIIDANNLFVSPGFIDFHSHVDGNEYPACCLVKQGGTTTLEEKEI